MVGYRIRKNNKWRVEANGEVKEFKTMKQVAEYLDENPRTCYCIFYKTYKYKMAKTVKYKDIIIDKL